MTGDPPTINIHIRAQMAAADGRVGELTRVVVDSRNHALRHLVVRGQGVLGVERLVPSDDVVDATEDNVALRASRADFDSMPPFDRTVEYTPPGIGDTYVDQIRSDDEIEVDQDSFLKTSSPCVAASGSRQRMGPSVTWTE